MTNVQQDAYSPIAFTMKITSVHVLYIFEIRILLAVNHKL